jgi:hypothetical protein
LSYPASRCRLRRSWTGPPATAPAGPTSRSLRSAAEEQIDAGIAESAELAQDSQRLAADFGFEVCREFELTPTGGLAQNRGLERGDGNGSRVPLGLVAGARQLFDGLVENRIGIETQGPGVLLAQVLEQ